MAITERTTSAMIHHGKRGSGNPGLPLRSPASYGTVRKSFLDPKIFSLGLPDLKKNDDDDYHNRYQKSKRNERILPLLDFDRNCLAMVFRCPEKQLFSYLFRRTFESQ